MNEAYWIDSNESLRVAVSKSYGRVRRLEALAILSLSTANKWRFDGSVRVWICVVVVRNTLEGSCPLLSSKIGSKTVHGYITVQPRSSDFCVYRGRIITFVQIDHRL